MPDVPHVRRRPWRQQPQGVLPLPQRHSLQPGDPLLRHVEHGGLPGQHCHLALSVERCPRGRERLHHPWTGSLRPLPGLSVEEQGPRHKWILDLPVLCNVENCGHFNAPIDRFDTRLMTKYKILICLAYGAQVG